MIVGIKLGQNLVLFVCTLCVAFVFTGCQSGSTGGRIDPYSTTRGENRGGQVSMPALLEFSDETAEQLIYDLSSIPEIRDAPTQVVLELGDILNKTRSSTIDYELVQRKLRGKIQNSGLAREYFLIVENRQRMDREKARITGGGQPDLLQEGTGNTGTAIYDPNITYVLQGSFLESVRSGVSRYYFEFSLTNLGSRQRVFGKDYVLGQERD